MGEDMKIGGKFVFQQLEHEGPTKGLERWVVIGNPVTIPKEVSVEIPKAVYYRDIMGYWIHPSGVMVGNWSIESLLNSARDGWIGENFKWERI